MVWLTYRARKARIAGEGYGTHVLNEPKLEGLKLPSWQLSVLPLLAVLVINYVGNKVVDWNPHMLDQVIDMKLPLAASSIKSVISTWSLLIAVSVGIAIAGSVGFSACLKAR